MKVPHLNSGYGLFIIGLLTLQSQLAFAVYSMSETCAQMKESYIADPADCQNYGYCKNGVLVGTKKCDKGLLYDARLGKCNYADKVKCNTRLESTCSNIDSPVYVADPDDCTQACYCNGKGKYTCESCPVNQVFNPNTKACVWSKDYNCPADSICRLVPDNNFVGDPKACGKYVTCFAGSGESSECPENYWFNPLTSNCENVDICKGKPENPTPGIGLGVETNLPKNADMCKKFQTPQADNEAYFVSDEKTCMGYYICKDKTGPGTWLKCPMGTHFDQTNQKCVTPYTVKCTRDRCANINQQYVSAIGCKSYNFCVNQTNVVSYGRSCEELNPDFPFFDETLGACVNSDPSYTICKE